MSAFSNWEVIMSNIAIWYSAALLAVQGSKTRNITKEIPSFTHRPIRRTTSIAINVYPLLNFKMHSVHFTIQGVRKL